MRVDGQEVELRFEHRAHPTPAALSLLTDDPEDGRATVVIADRISEAGRSVLREAGWGWLDRRGHLRIWAPGLRLETPFEPPDRRPTRVGNPWTTVGLEVAVAALCDPDAPVTARRIAEVIGRSVGATHEMVGRFTELGLVGQRTRLALLPELFWETAAQWPDGGWTALPIPIDDLAAHVDTTDLIRVDERAATLGGARIAAAGDLPARVYVPSTQMLRRARALADRSEGDDQPTRCWVREAPVNWLPTMDEHPPDADHPWWVAHPIVSALRLAADPARGREIVEDWGIVPERDGG